MSSEFPYPERLPASVRRGLAKLEAELAGTGRADVCGHAGRVAESAAALSRAIGLPDADVERVSAAARFHDVGKLRVPAEILHKPGRLDDDERRIMDRHAAAGAELLAAIAHVPQDFVAVARYHHERFDGFGYEGLAGDGIPLFARIVAVADVHDAMASARVYRADLIPEDVVLKMMAADVPSPGFGRRAFDPHLLRAFFAMRVRDPDFVAGPEARRELCAFAVSPVEAPAPETEAGASALARSPCPR